MSWKRGLGFLMKRKWIEVAEVGELLKRNSSEVCLVMMKVVI